MVKWSRRWSSNPEVVGLNPSWVACDLCQTGLLQFHAAVACVTTFGDFDINPIIPEGIKTIKIFDIKSITGFEARLPGGSGGRVVKSLVL